MAEDTETTEETEAGSRSQMWKHEDCFDWLVSEGFITEDASGAEIIAAFAANRNAYRKTERYSDLVESHKAEAEQAKAERAAEREAAREAREAEKAAKAAAKAEAAAKADGEKPPAKKAPAKKAAAKKAPAKKGSDEDPFG